MKRRRERRREKRDAVESNKGKVWGSESKDKKKRVEATQRLRLLDSKGYERDEAIHFTLFTVVYIGLCTLKRTE